MKRVNPNPRNYLPNSNESAETIGSVDDLFTQILLRLPIKSLLRFKSVSKPWLAVITNPQFRTIRGSSTADGLYTRINTLPLEKYNYIPIGSDDPSSTAPSINFEFMENPSDYRQIVHSSYGLLLCCSSSKPRKNSKFTSGHMDRSFYVYNPTTNQFVDLPEIQTERHHGATLVFNPVESPHYKVVLVKRNEIYVYSSETRGWKRSGVLRNQYMLIHFDKGAYWNGSVHWLYWSDLCDQPLGKSSLSWRFHVDSELVANMPTPPLSHLFSREDSYFGESSGHLLFVESGNPQLKIFEMERDYSEWFVKCIVDTSCVLIAYPHCSVNLLTVLGKEDVDSVVVLSIGSSRIGVPNKAIKLNFVDGTIKELQDVDRFCDASSAFSYIPSLCCV